jgi:hypothetical protein
MTGRSAVLECEEREPTPSHQVTAVDTRRPACSHRSLPAASPAVGEAFDEVDGPES